MKKLLLSLKFLGLLVLSVLVFLLSVCSLLLSILNQGIFKIVMEGIYLFFIFKNEQGEFVGFDVDIVKVVVQKFNFKFEFVFIEWSGILVGFQVNKYDVIVNQVGIMFEW